MKRRLFAILMFAACFYGAIAQNDAMLVYLSDGGVKAFLKANVESIRYSRTDLDSLVHREYVVQEVWARDSVYRVPLTEIDSVTFAALCPEGNLPQAIDLGLPSGTKWCSHNVGASSPEDYGGYYAWGETKEKEVYNVVTYAYKDVENWYIGTDISGTRYDVAHVGMGDDWRLPTQEQMQELVENCSWHWTQLNGVNGMLVTGPNEGRIFLPAAGECNTYNGQTLWEAGSRGYYWSGSLHPEYDGAASYIGFSDSYLGCFGWMRWDGLSVRPVCHGHE